MYRQYFKSTINTDKLKEINRNAPEGVKYCNGLCQDLEKKVNFQVYMLYVIPVEIL